MTIIAKPTIGLQFIITDNLWYIKVKQTRCQNSKCRLQ